MIDWRAWVWVVGTAVAMLVAANEAAANPVWGEKFELRQPDGSLVPVRIWGDEYYQVVESPDGYTLVRHPKTLEICYATLSPDGSQLVPTTSSASQPLSATLKISPHIRITQEAKMAEVERARARFSVAEEQTRKAVGISKVSTAPSTGDVKGICLLVDFSDDVGTIARSVVDNYCNDIGYTGGGNNGSVYDYFSEVSGGVFRYTNYVTPVYYRALHPKGYYDNPSVPNGSKARELIIEALNWLDGQGFDFSQYDANHDGLVDGINCLYAGNCNSGWAMGLWPHSWTVDFTRDGVSTYKYQITNMGSSLSIGTFCHENGHMICWWPDLYDYDHDSAGVGTFCLMCSGGSSTNPVQPCCYLKSVSHWGTVTDLVTPQSGLSVSSTLNSFYRFPHPTLPNEFYMIDNRQATGRDASLHDSGLALWHIDTNGSNNNQQQTPSSHYLVTLVQADGDWDLEHNVNQGDSTDLFDAASYNQCGSSTNPTTNWWDGNMSGLLINSISASGPTMTFSFAIEHMLGIFVAAWGDNTSGQCNVPSPNVGFVAVAGGGQHSLGLKSNGSVVAWGYGNEGQCNIPSPNVGFVAVSAGEAHSLGLKYDGSVVAWGDNYNGQCNVPSPNAGFVAVAAGKNHSLGVKSDGSVVAWGNNDYRQCSVPSPNTGFVDVAAGLYHSLGLKSDGTVVVWGDNTSGQYNVPSPNADSVAVAAGGWHSLGVKSAGSVVAWGHTNYGQCNVPSPNANFVAVAAGNAHSFGLKSDGSIAAWGNNDDYACNVPSPNAEFVAVAAGWFHSLALSTTPTSPTIFQHPISWSVWEGGAALFVVQGVGSVPLSYQWRKNGVNISGATSSNYTIPSAQQANEGFYTCVVANAVGSATSNAAVLSVDGPNEPPEANFYTLNAWGSPPHEVSFIDASIAGASPIFDWAWDFGDGHTLSGEDPSPIHVYELTGVYTVKLTVTTLLGSSTKTATDVIVVSNQLPVAPWGLLVAAITLAALALRYRKVRS